jgi:hypothetical protein
MSSAAPVRARDAAPAAKARSERSSASNDRISSSIRLAVACDSGIHRAAPASANARAFAV